MVIILNMVCASQAVAHPSEYAKAELDKVLQSEEFRTPVDAKKAPLLEALLQRDFDAVRNYVQLGGDGDVDAIITEGGQTPLMVACMLGEKSILKFFSDHRLGEKSINMQDKSGFTALMWAVTWAVANEDDDMVLLFIFGALTNPVKLDLSVMNRNGETAIDMMDHALMGKALKKLEDSYKDEIHQDLREKGFGELIDAYYK